MNEKDSFDAWNVLKKRLNEKNKTIFFSPREIWWCSLGKNIGHEQDGKHSLFERPILIIKRFNRSIFLAIPLSSQSKSGAYYYAYRRSGKSHIAIISQLRLLDAKRLQRKIGKMSENDFLEIKNLIKSFL